MMVYRRGMRTVAGSVLALLVWNVAHAQPGAPPPPWQPYPPPPQGYAVPPPHAYQPQPVQLTADEADLLARGEISDAAHMGGGLAALFLGFGIGQAVQGRWSDKGWIFTVGEGASWFALFYGVAHAIGDCFANDDDRCDDDRSGSLIVAGALGLTVFRIWGTIDAFAAPSSHNARVRELRMRTGYDRPGYYSVIPYVKRNADGEGGVAGLTLRW